MPHDGIDYHPDSGAGSYEDAVKDSTQPQTERSMGDTGATTFEPLEAPPTKVRRFNELRKRHHEHWNKDGDKQLNDTNIAYDVRMVCNRLEMTDYQQSRVLNLVDDHRQQGLRYEITILGVVTYVLNEDGRWIQRGDSEFGDELHGEYEAIRESFNVTKSQIKNVKKTISG